MYPLFISPLFLSILILFHELAADLLFGNVFKKETGIYLVNYFPRGHNLVVSHSIGGIPDMYIAPSGE